MKAVSFGEAWFAMSSVSSRFYPLVIAVIVEEFVYFDSLISRDFEGPF